TAVADAPVTDGMVGEDVSDGRGPRIESLPADPRERLAAALRDPELIEPFSASDDVRSWLASQDELVIGVALTDPRPRRGSLLGLAVAGRDGRTIAADSEQAEAFADAVLGAGKPL